MSRSILSLLRAPGYGLLTVSTGGERAQKYLRRYGDPEKVSKNWSKHLNSHLRIDQDYFVIGIPSDTGASICRGAAHGPLALREALVDAQRLSLKQDLGDIPVVPQVLHDSMLNAPTKNKIAKALGANPKQAVSALSLLEATLLELKKRNPRFRPWVLGGDHSISSAVFSFVEKSYGTQKLAVLHLDAHTDLLTERFGVEYCFGTWAGRSVTRMKNPGQWVQVGIRSSGKNQKHWEKKFGLKQIWAEQCLKSDPKKLAAQLVDQWRRQGCESLYLSFDVDSLDSSYVSATGTPESGGLNPKWLKVFLAECTRELPLVASDLVELAPVLGSKAQIARSTRSVLSAAEGILWKPTL